MLLLLNGVCVWPFVPHQKISDFICIIISVNFSFIALYFILILFSIQYFLIFLGIFSSSGSKESNLLCYIIDFSFSFSFSIIIEVNILAAKGDITFELFHWRLGPPTETDWVPVTEAGDTVVVSIPDGKVGELGARTRAAHDCFPHVSWWVDTDILSLALQCVNQVLKKNAILRTRVAN